MNSKRLERENATVQKMIALYCRGQHDNPKGQLCPDCQALSEYVTFKLAHCPFGDDKPTCLNCTVHCYQPEQRDEIRKVMRYAGPRMMFHHPFLAASHLLDGLHKPTNKG